MQCVSCHFENMPGSEVCGRCGSSLTLATAKIDVHPPRARKWSKQIRQTLRIRPVMRLLDWMSDGLRNRGVLRIFFNSGPGIEPILLRLPIPGWSQWRAGYPVRGKIFLIAWLVALVLGLYLMGTLRGSLMLGLAFSVHVAAAIDALTPYLPSQTFLRRVGYSIGLGALFAAVFYVPATQLITRWADPIVLTRPSGPFDTNDVLLINHAIRRYQPGQLVMFDIGNSRAVMEDRRNIYYAGERIDRVIAGPGDVVHWKNGQFTVNGSTCAVLPLVPRSLPAEFSVTVPEGHFLIFPTATPYLDRNSSPATWMNLSVIPTERISGVVYLRKLPITRISLVH